MPPGIQSQFLKESTFGDKTSGSKFMGFGTKDKLFLRQQMLKRCKKKYKNSEIHFNKDVVERSKIQCV